MSLASKLAVCSWSLRPKNPADLLQQLQNIGINRLQIALSPLQHKPEVWAPLTDLCARNGITFASGMIETVGEDYSTLESIKRTGGVVPDATWDENWRNVQASAALAQKLGLKLVTFHAGFLPDDPANHAFIKLLYRITSIADVFAAHGIELGFETGQETAEALLAFLHRLDKPNVGVNFDPANIILYGREEPIAALRLLGPWLKQIHIKDAVKTKVPGTWGEEVVVGTGQVDWHEFFRTAASLCFDGNFAIEREAGEQRAADILTARKFVEPFLR